MTGHEIIDLIQMIFPTMSSGLASTISYVLTFGIGLIVAVPSIALWIRSKLPTIIAFIMYVYNETVKAEKLSVTDKKGITNIATGEEKKVIVMDTLCQELLDPKNEIVTEKNLKLFKKLTGWGNSLSSIIEFVVPIMKANRKNKPTPTSKT